jgi:DNA polymerase-3 subunit epsilon
VLSLDLETTGLDTGSDRVVEVALVRLTPDGVVRPSQTVHELVSQERPIPPTSTAVHGITDARCRAEGRPAVDVLGAVAAALRDGVDEGLPVVVFNARFDWPLLTAECRRHGVTLPSGVALLDPLVLDRRLSPPIGTDGGLVGRCRRHGILVANAHRAFDDAVAAGRLVQSLARAHPLLRVLGLDDLAQLQVRWDRWYRGTATAVAPWPTALPGHLDRAG